MPLVLKTLRGPAGVAPDRRRVAGGSFSIGRGTDCDWTLPDPGRVLSKRHCSIAPRGEGWTVTDSSSNGTFLNGHSIDPNVPHPIREGDRLTLGAYEIEARFDGEATDESDAAARQGVKPGLFGEDRLTGDPFGPLDGDAAQIARPSIGLPADFDPLVAGDKVAENPYAVPDHTPDLQQHFRAPRPSFELLPEDWDLDAGPAQPEPASPPPAEPAPVAPARSPHPESTSTDSVAGFAALAAGAGVAGAQPDDADAALRSLGAAFRAMVGGLRRLMIARATIKGEFRIEQTMIRPDGNNPLKFAANDDDALAALLGTGRKSGMTPEQAVADALRDMRLHELAVTAAMHRAVRDLLGQIAPARVMQGVHDTGGGVLGRLLGRREKAGWVAYEALHGRMVRALDDEFDSVFGKSFGRAYEAALADIAGQDGGENPG